MTAAPTLAGGAAGGAPPVDSAIWMVTFTDLIGLLLAFFVMMFAMATIEEGEWQRVAGALSNGPSQVAGDAGIRPRVDRNSGETPAVEGRNIDYLAAVLDQRLAADPRLDRVRLLRRPDGIALVLPIEAPSHDGAPAGRPARELLVALSDALRSMPNRIEVEGLVRGGGDAAAFAAEWERTMTRALGLARGLEEAGHPEPLDVFVRIADEGAGAVAVSVRDAGGEP